MDLVLLMDYLLEYSDKSCLWNYYRDEMNDNAIKNKDDYYKINNGKATASKFIEYKAKIIGTKSNDPEEHIRPGSCCSTNVST